MYNIYFSLNFGGKMLQFWGAFFNQTDNDTLLINFKSNESIIV